MEEDGVISLSDDSPEYLRNGSLEIVGSAGIDVFEPLGHALSNVDLIHILLRLILSLQKPFLILNIPPFTNPVHKGRLNTIVDYILG